MADLLGPGQGSRSSRATTDLPTLGESSIYRAIHAERERAHRKHRPESAESFGYLAPDWDRIIAEEWGEIARVHNDYRHGVFDAAERDRQLAKEAVQFAAMAAAYAEACVARRGEQATDA